MRVNIIAIRLFTLDMVAVITHTVHIHGALHDKNYQFELASGLC